MGRFCYIYGAAKIQLQTFRFPKRNANSISVAIAPLLEQTSSSLLSTSLVGFETCFLNHLSRLLQFAGDFSVDSDRVLFKIPSVLSADMLPLGAVSGPQISKLPTRIL